MSDKCFNFAMLLIQAVLVFCLGVAFGHDDLLKQSADECSTEVEVTTSTPINL